jgi:putative sterol carrier protein
MAMPALPKAPENITPKKFFTEWLPQQLAPFQNAIKQFGGSLRVCVSFKVEGPRGGEWTAAAEGGEVKIQNGLKENAVVTLILAAKDLVDVVTGKRKLAFALPGKRGGKNRKPEAITKQFQKTIETLAGIEGMFQVRIEDPGQDFVVSVKFKGPLKKEPDAVVAIDRADLDAMAAKGKLNARAAVAAFMSGKFRITGDMGLLVQTLMPLMMK